MDSMIQESFTSTPAYDQGLSFTNHCVGQRARRTVSVLGHHLAFLLPTLAFKGEL
jgi:hypothetical protein